VTILARIKHARELVAAMDVSAVASGWDAVFPAVDAAIALLRDDELLALGERAEAAEAEVYVLKMRAQDDGIERDDLRADLSVAEAKLAAAEANDARYRWLVSEHERIDPIAAVVWKANGRGDHNWVNTANLTREVDAAIGAGK
jgi:hypothetical protein